MNHPEKIGVTDEAPIEVELSVQDLLELSSPQPTQHRENDARQYSEQRAGEVTAAIAQPTQTQKAPISSHARRSATRIVLALTTGLAAVMIVGAHQDQPSTPEHPSASSPPPLQPEPASFEKPAQTTDIERPPVRYKNPFDRTEVFEFPPGTSQADARAAVADMLMKRATEREQEINARVLKRAPR